MGITFYPIEDPTLYKVRTVMEDTLPILNEYLANRDLYKKYSDDSLSDIIEQHKDYLKQKGYLTEDGSLNIEAIQSNIDNDQIAKIFYDVYQLRTRFKDASLSGKAQMLRDPNLAQLMSGSMLTTEIKKLSEKNKEKEALAEFLKGYGLNNDQVDKLMNINNPMLLALFITKLINNPPINNQPTDNQLQDIQITDTYSVSEKSSSNPYVYPVKKKGKKKKESSINLPPLKELLGQSNNSNQQSNNSNQQPNNTVQYPKLPPGKSTISGKLDIVPRHKNFLTDFINQLFGWKPQSTSPLMLKNLSELIKQQE